MATHADTEYDEFLDTVRRLTLVADAGGVLSWDQQVTMPEGGTPARSKQLSALSSIRHELLTGDEMASHLDRLDEGELDDDRAAIVRETRREHERQRRVPGDLVEEIAETTSEALPVWEEAKAESNFGTFAPTLERIVDLKREYAEHVAPDRDPYAVLMEDYEPYLDFETIESVLTRLRDELPPLIEAIRESDVDPGAGAYEGTFDPADQEALSRDVLSTMGYDWDRGRLDTSAHPFTSGNQFDSRITTRFDESDPSGGFTATIHEFGHAMYNLGVPGEEYGTPLGSPRELTVHESQSRFYENHVGRSRAFWNVVTDDVNDHLGTDLTPREGYEAANRIAERNPIRVEADELTYHLHIAVRFEVERDLIRGDIEVGEVPAAWNDRMDEYLGFRPESDAEGCLQDIHWTHGSFGYFPTYTLGSMLAAQLDAAMREEVAVDDHVRAGEFEPIHEWLGDAVHRHGRRYTTPELIERATGEPLGADYFLGYATEKYGSLYDVSV